ncbi:MAG: hypothetical protein JWQ68_1458 [Cryobacterium sp.]|nr:hypothetical protein [Cryobacterium sp.]
MSLTPVKRTAGIAAVVLAGLLATGAIAAQALTGGTDDNRPTPTSTIDPITVPTQGTNLPTDADHPQGDDSIGRTDDQRGNGADDVIVPPVPVTGLPTDADHPQGDDSIGRVDDQHDDAVDDDGYHGDNSDRGHSDDDNGDRGHSDDDNGVDDNGGHSGDDNSGHDSGGHGVDDVNDDH